MKTCPYCASNLQTIGAQQKHYCDFCDMFVEPAENGRRAARYNEKALISFLDLQKTTPEFMTLHTFDLLVLLRFAREEKQKNYDLLISLKRGGVEFAKEAREAGDLYEYSKRKAWCIENILVDRIGYYPERITEELLDRWKQRMEKMNKTMKIRKEQPAS